VLFLAGGLAFNVLLALVPFVLLLIAGLSLLLNREPGEAAETVAALGFAWFSTRLVGSLRSVLALIFDGTDRGIVSGKLFDLAATVVATFAVVLYVIFSAYLDLATSQGASFLLRMGLRGSAMSGIGYVFGRLIANSVVFILFFSLYRGLPRRRPSVRVAAVGGLAASLLFELARHLFALLVAHFDPSSLYTGTIAAVVATVFWTYYSALLFMIGGEVAQAYELRRGHLAERQRQEAPGEPIPMPALPDRTLTATEAPATPPKPAYTPRKFNPAVREPKAVKPPKPAPKAAPGPAPKPATPPATKKTK
jgi:membrane protein